MPKQLTDECPEERPGTRIRAFLSKVRPLSGSTGHEDIFWEGRSLIESLALSYEIMTVSDYDWTLAQCATVLSFLQVIEPAEGHCFCGGYDREEQGISITCGHHLILQQIEDQLLRIEPAKQRKRVAEAAPCLTKP